MNKRGMFKLLSVYLVFSVFLITLPSQGWAMFIRSANEPATRTADMAAIQKTLESTVIQQRLMEYGLSSSQALDRISRLSDEQIHQFAGQLDSLQAGADGVDALIFIVLVAIIVVLVLQLSGHQVIIR
jgi:hypothetical protein